MADQAQVNVPDVDGVPVVNFSGGVGTGLTLANVDTGPITAQLSPVQWGIYLGGAPVIIANSTVSFEFRKEWLLLDYPVERGGFETYNKVWTPFSGRVRIASGGDFAARSATLQSVKAIAGDTNLYSLMMPEFTFPSCNIMHYDFNRDAVHSLGMLVIDVWVQEVAQLGSSTFANTSNPSDQAISNDGTVNPEDSPAPASGGPEAGVGGNIEALPDSPGAGGGPTPTTDPGPMGPPAPPPNNINEIPIGE